MSWSSGTRDEEPRTWTLRSPASTVSHPPEGPDSSDGLLAVIHGASSSGPLPPIASNGEAGPAAGLFEHGHWDREAGDRNESSFPATLSSPVTELVGHRHGR